MKPEVIEYNDQEVAIYDLPQNDEGNAMCDISITGAFRLSSKTKALIVVLPQHSNEVPIVVNVGLNQREITKSVDILAHAQRYGEQYGGNVRSVLQEA